MESHLDQASNEKINVSIDEYQEDANKNKDKNKRKTQFNCFR